MREKLCYKRENGLLSVAYRFKTRTCDTLTEFLRFFVLFIELNRLLLNIFYFKATKTQISSENPRYYCIESTTTTTQFQIIIIFMHSLQFPTK